MNHVHGQGLISCWSIADGQLAYDLVVVGRRQVKFRGLAHGAGDGLGFDHGLVGIIIDPANGSCDRWHWIGKGNRQLGVGIGDGHRWGGVGVGGMIVMGQDGGFDSVPMSR